MEVKVKICGITNLADAQAAVTSGADLLGFIFVPKSPRYATAGKVRDILDGIELVQASVLTVGVFVNESPGAITQTLDFCGLDLAQLHGEEPPSMLGLSDGPTQPAEDRDQFPLRGRAYRALRPCSLDEAMTSARRYALPPRLQGGGRLPAFLLDAHHPHLRGGAGQTGDWRLAALLADRYPLLLAGGLTPANVAQAVHTVHPWGVDGASGVEELPGQKDHAALRAFVAAARDAQVATQS
ncbi:MAG: phosphoribosylanthranilate isomerase [Ardenticatenia bacterium]|nr:phosphoribosylanthranilate isomerase [Ardenticatenia bacterium]